MKVISFSEQMLDLDKVSELLYEHNTAKCMLNPVLFFMLLQINRTFNYVVNKGKVEKNPGLTSKR